MPCGPSADRGVLLQLPQLGRPSHDNVRVCRVLDGNQAQGVRFAVRTADRDARDPLPLPVGQGASSKEVAVAAAPSPGSLPACQAQHIAWARDPRRVAALEGLRASRHPSIRCPPGRYGPACRAGRVRGPEGRIDRRGPVHHQHHGGANHHHGPTAGRQGACLAQRGLGRERQGRELLPGPGQRAADAGHRAGVQQKLAAWGRQLRRLGAPSDRLQPAYTLVRKAIQAYDKGANCYARAAGVISVGGAVGSEAEARVFQEMFDCGNAGEGWHQPALQGRRKGRSGRLKTADEPAVAPGVLQLSSVWKVRPVPRWPSCRCRREDGRQAPRAGPLSS